VKVKQRRFFFRKKFDGNYEWQWRRTADSELHGRATASADVSTEQYACINTDTNHRDTSDISIHHARQHRDTRAQGRKRASTIRHCAQWHVHCRRASV
jgi:hypothetical protein